MSQSTDELLSRLRDPTGPLPIHEQIGNPLWIGLLLLAGTAVLAIGYSLLRRQRGPAALSPAEIATANLDHLSELSADEYMERLDAVVRIYLGSTTNLPADQMTPSELAAALSSDRAQRWSPMLDAISKARFSGEVSTAGRTTDLIARTRAAIQADSVDSSDGGDRKSGVK